MKYELLNKAIDELGFESVVYVALCGVVGLGIGCLVGYTTKSIIKSNEKENE